MRFAGQKIEPEIVIALLPGGEQGPAQGPNIPIKNYGGVYMPDATQPTGYKPGPLAGNILNPLDWFSGENQNTINGVNQGDGSGVTADTPIGDLLRRKAEQERMLQML